MTTGEIDGKMPTMTNQRGFPFGKFCRLPTAATIVAGYLVALPVCLPSAKSAETTHDSASGAQAASEAKSAAGRKKMREIELEAIQESIAISENRQAGLRAEIEAMEADRAALSKTLIETAQRLRLTELEISRIEDRLDGLFANEDGVRASLRARRAVLAEVLAALQRMGRTPPPAILSQPEDALAAIRSSILAGAVLPHVRVEAEALANDLQELTELSHRIKNELESLKTRYASLGEEQARINLLIETKKSQREKSLGSLESERRKAAVLANQAENVEALIAALEKEIGVTPPAGEVRASTGPEETARRLADAGRLAPAMPFADALGLLPLPVSGQIMVNFGGDDGLGGRAKGATIAARAGMHVISPTDGWIVYAGPFRSYGNILILNAGSGYHIVLAGMERIDVVPGQFVLAGEPVAVMGSRQYASLGDLDHKKVQTVLYVEFRKDGKSIDPSPWWDRRDEEEVRG